MANAKKEKKQDKRKLMTRVVCIVLAALMVFTVIGAAVLSSIW